ncbi:MAG: hypothetical protein JNJ58_13430 [Chitinophagaceae bacterium]|nr:hypothetical protein [Chitinophagaceae bacterium]
MKKMTLKTGFIAVFACCALLTFNSCSEEKPAETTTEAAAPAPAEAAPAAAPAEAAAPAAAPAAEAAAPADGGDSMDKAGTRPTKPAEPK